MDLGSLSTGQITVLLMTLALVLIWFSVIRVQWRRRNGGTSAPEYGRGIAPGITSPSQAVEQAHSATVGEWEVRLHELGRDIEGRITSKLGLLENLVREADRAAARLEAALRAFEQLRQTQAAGVLQPPDLTCPEPSMPQQGVFQVSGTAPRGDSPVPQPNAASAMTISDSRPSDTVRNARPHEEIYTLSDYGYDPDEIARRTGVPVGEVQLILSLRKTRRTSEPQT